MTKANRERLGRNLVKWLQLHKATPHSVGLDGWHLPTRAGTLWVHFDSEWGTIFCRFLDVEAARVQLGVTRLFTSARLNPCSGKWNFHFGKVAWRDALDAFTREAGPLILDAPACSCEAGAELGAGPWHDPQCKRYAETAPESVQG